LPEPIMNSGTSRTISTAAVKARQISKKAILPFHQS
jgi:hypothetical protein